MIKIRYADLPQDLHKPCPQRRPVIYLLPGLSPAQRRDAPRRLIRTSRQGHGVRLRVSGVAPPPPPGSPGPRPPAQPGGLCLQLALLGVCISG